MYWFTSLLLRAVGAISILGGALVAATGAGPFGGGRIGGLDLAILGGLLLYTGTRLRAVDGQRRQLQGVRDQLHFLDEARADRNFWPDGL